jgi:hypothetical protein
MESKINLAKIFIKCRITKDHKLIAFLKSLKNKNERKIKVLVNIKTC